MLDGNVLDHWNYCSPWYVLIALNFFFFANNFFSFTFSFSKAIAWLIIPLDVEIRHGWFLFHSWNLFVAICAIPRYA